MKTAINNQLSMNSKKYFVFRMLRRVILPFLFFTVSAFLLQDECNAQGTWATKASMPVATPLWMAAASAGTNIYVAGGNNGSPLSTCYKYNSATNSWSSIASLPETIYQGDGLCAIGGKLYMPGGWNGSLPVSTLFIYDTSSNTWTTGASMPALSGDGACGVINGKLYVFNAENGYSSPPYQNQLYVYDPVGNSWTTLASAPSAHAYPAYGVINGKFYVGGGINGSSNVGNTLDVYDPGTNTWATKASMPVAGTSFGSAVINGKLYVVGGQNASNVVMDTVLIYDPATDKWSSGPSMPTAISGMGVAVINGTLYAAGGGNGVSSSAGVEAFSLAPAAPLSLTATAGNAQIALAWSKNTESDFLKYRIYRGTSSGGETLVDSTSAGITDTTRVIFGLTNGTSYYFEATAMDSARLESGYSNEVSATPYEPPTISSFSPTSGLIGTTVTITGTNFNTTASNNVVYFGAVKATVNSASSTSLNVTVPDRGNVRTDYGNKHDKSLNSVFFKAIYYHIYFFKNNNFK